MSYNSVTETGVLHEIVHNDCYSFEKLVSIIRGNSHNNYYVQAGIPQLQFNHTRSTLQFYAIILALYTNKLIVAIQTTLLIIVIAGLL